MQPVVVDAVLRSATFCLRLRSACGYAVLCRVDVYVVRCSVPFSVLVSRAVQCARITRTLPAIAP